MQRINEIQSDIENAYLDAFLVTDATNIFYLTGFKLIQGDGLLLIHQETGYLITDDRYEEALTEFDDKSLVGCISRRYFSKLKECCEQLHITVLGFESKISYREYDILDEIMDADIVPMTDFIENHRANKDTQEIETITATAALHDEAFDYLSQYIQVGMTEIQIANQLDWWMKQYGASKASFDTIVASGANAAKPHALSTSKKISSGDILIIDYGYFLDGYTADVTRTVGLPGVADEFDTIYRILTAAKEQATARIVPGVKGSEIDKVARQIIADAGYGEYFNHGIGHGIGLDIHELPTSYGADNSTLLEQQVVTIEPGIYLPHNGGIRIEDDLLITSTGVQQLTHAPKQLPIL